MAEPNEEQNESMEELKLRIQYLESLLDFAIRTAPVRISAPVEREGVRAIPLLDVEITRQFTKHSAELMEVRTIIAELSEQLEISGVLKNAKMQRIIPITLYIAESYLRYTPWVDALDGVVEALGIDDYVRSFASYGSYLEKWFGRTKEKLTQKEVVDRLKKVERALELKGIDNPQADVDLKLAQATHELSQAFDNTSTAVALLGSLCVLKVDGKMLSITLTPEQLAQISNDPGLITNPAALREAIFGGNTAPVPRRTIRVRKPAAKTGTREIGKE